MSKREKSLKKWKRNNTKSKKSQKKIRETRNKSRTRRNLKMRRGGSFSLPISRVIPFNNYLDDVQRDTISTRIIP
jgi:hypothetical protein